jgi:hypothetical protein
LSKWKRRSVRAGVGPWREKCEGYCGEKSVK